MQAEQNIKIISDTHLSPAFNAKSINSNWQKITSDLTRSRHCTSMINHYTQMHITILKQK